MSDRARGPQTVSQELADRLSREESVEARQRQLRVRLNSTREMQDNAENDHSLQGRFSVPVDPAVRSARDRDDQEPQPGY